MYSFSPHCGINAILSLETFRLSSRLSSRHHIDTEEATASNTVVYRRSMLLILFAECGYTNLAECVLSWGCVAPTLSHFRNAIKDVACAQTPIPFRNAIKCPVYKSCVHLPHCPEQAPTGARSSSVKKMRVGGYTENGSTIFTQGPTPDANLAAMGPNRLTWSVRPRFVEASPTVEKAVLHYKADRLVASMLSFRSVQSSLAVREFRAAGEERCESMTACHTNGVPYERGHGRVCANLWCRGAQNASEQSQICELSGPINTREFSMVGGYTENPQNCQNWGGRLLGYGCLLGTIRYVSLLFPAL